MNISELVKLGEGYREKPYLCSAGKLTIGYGWNLEDNGIPHHIAEQLLEIGISTAKSDLSQVFGPSFMAVLATYEPVRYMVLVDMMYNLGIKKFLGFKNMIAAVKAKDWEKAAVEAKDSKWFHDVKFRAIRNVYMLRHGKEMILS